MHEEDITSEYVLDWLLQYIYALTKMAEGIILRKAGAIGITNDGGDLFNEGKEAKEKLEQKLAIEGRWMSFSRRM
jgi:hypothetical protein